MGVCSKCGLRTVSQDCECLQRQLQQAQQDLAKERENGLREANACEQARLAALRAHDDLAEAQAEKGAAIEHRQKWKEAAKIEWELKRLHRERAGAAEALARWSGKALVLAYVNMGQENWARMTDRAKNTIINNVQLAEAQARQKEDE